MFIVVLGYSISSIPFQLEYIIHSGSKSFIYVYSSVKLLFLKGIFLNIEIVYLLDTLKVDNKHSQELFQNNFSKGILES